MPAFSVVALSSNGAPVELVLLRDVRSAVSLYLRRRCLLCAAKRHKLGCPVVEQWQSCGRDAGIGQGRGDYVSDK